VPNAPAEAPAEGAGERQGRRRNRRGGRGRDRDRDDTTSAERIVADQGAVEGHGHDAAMAPGSDDTVSSDERLRAANDDERIARSADGEPSAGEGGFDEQRGEGGRRRGGRGRGRDRDRAPRDVATSADRDAFAVGGDAPPIDGSAGSTARDDREGRDVAAAPLVARDADVAPSARASADEWRPAPAPSRPAFADSVTAPAEPTPRREPPPRAEPAPLTRAEPYALPIDSLAAVAESAGLQWVNSDAGKIEAARAAMAAIPAPARVPREIVVPPAVDEGPLVMVETKKDLAQVRLPFETTAQETQGV
jgi:ribonuclease E